MNILTHHLKGVDAHTMRSYARIVGSRGISTLYLLFVRVFLMFCNTHVLLHLVEGWGAGDVVQLTECLPSVLEDLSSANIT